MKYVAVGGLGAFLGLILGAILGSHIAGKALAEFRQSNPDFVCGLPVLGGMLLWGLAGTVVGGVLGAAIAFILPDPTAHSTSDNVIDPQ